jgi:hypothetical protein
VTDPRKRSRRRRPWIWPLLLLHISFAVRRPDGSGRWLVLPAPSGSHQVAVRAGAGWRLAPVQCDVDWGSDCCSGQLCGLVPVEVVQQYGMAVCTK